MSIIHLFVSRRHVKVLPVKVSSAHLPAFVLSIPPPPGGRAFTCIQATQHRDIEQWSMRQCRWAGLIRGAVSVALVYYFFDPKGQSEDSHRATLIAATLVCVMVSIIVFGALTKGLLDLTLGPQGTAQAF